MLDKIKETSLKFKGSEKHLMAVGAISSILGILSFIMGNNVLGWLLLLVCALLVSTALLCYYVQLNKVYKSIKKDVETVKAFINPISNIKNNPTIKKSYNTGNIKDVTDSLKD